MQGHGENPVLVLKFLQLTAKHLNAAAMSGVTDDLPADDNQRRVHFIAVRALQEAGAILETAAVKIETGARP